jgi:hypothetical protein
MRKTTTGFDRACYVYYKTTVSTISKYVYEGDNEEGATKINSCIWICVNVGDDTRYAGFR